MLPSLIPYFTPYFRPPLASTKLVTSQLHCKQLVSQYLLHEIAPIIRSCRRKCERNRFPFFVASRAKFVSELCQLHLNKVMIGSYLKVGLAQAVRQLPR